MSKNFSKEELDCIKIVVDSEINNKLNLLINTGFVPVEDPAHFRSVARAIVERSLYSWGFTPNEITVIGPNDDDKISISFTIDASQENTLLG